MWALNLQALQAFLFPRQGREAADSTFSSLYPSSSIPPSPSVLFTLCSPAAVPPRRHSRPPRSWRPPQIGRWRPSPWEQRVEVQEWVGEWRWRWLSGEDFLCCETRQEAEGMIKCGHALTFKIYTAGMWARWPTACLQQWIFVFLSFLVVDDHYKPMKPLWKRKGVLLLLYRQNWCYTSQLHRHWIKTVSSCRSYCYILSQLWLAGGFYTILLKFLL